MADLMRKGQATGRFLARITLAAAWIGGGLQAYAFVQLPMLSNLSGYQLFPHWTGTVGLAYRF
jgi:hypothetical protein